MLSRLTYYLTSIPTLMTQVRNWYAIPALVWGERPFIVHLRNGLQFRVRSLMDVWIIKETCLDRDYEVHGTEIEDGWTIIDVGAGLGDFSIFAAHQNPSGFVYALEPFPESFALLQENLALNHVANIRASELAVGSGSNEIALATTGAAVQHTTSVSKADHAASGTIKVEAISLNDLFAANAITRCDFLKLDCEGGEYGILFNASDETLAKIGHICLEYHNHLTPYSDRDLSRYLQNKGFRVTTTVNPAHNYIGFLYARR
jgi:FkbM family methyltransferase